VAETYRAGKASLTVDQDDLIRKLDTVTDGAASSFIRRSRMELEPIQKAAEPQWPVRTGESKRSFLVRHQLRQDRIDVDLANKAHQARFGFYALRIRYSVRTRASLDREISKHALRGTTPDTRAKLRQFWRRNLGERHGEGAPNAQLAGKKPWIEHVRKPGKKAGKRMTTDLRADMLRLARGP